MYSSSCLKFIELVLQSKTTLYFLYHGVTSKIEAIMLFGGIDWMWVTCNVVHMASISPNLLYLWDNWVWRQLQMNNVNHSGLYKYYFICDRSIICRGIHQRFGRGIQKSNRPQRDLGWKSLKRLLTCGVFCDNHPQNVLQRF